jgi:hypothetical protein
VPGRVQVYDLSWSFTSTASKKFEYFYGYFGCRNAASLRHDKPHAIPHVKFALSVSARLVSVLCLSLKTRDINLWRTVSFASNSFIWFEHYSKRGASLHA